MAHFVRLRASGFWTLASVVTPAEFESFDENLSKAINGDDGGVWAPSTRIEIGGAGLKVNELETSGYSEFGGDVSFQGPLVEVLAADFQIAGPATFQSAVAFDATANFNGTLNANGNVNLGDDTADLVNVAGTITIGLGLQCNGDANFAGMFTLFTGAGKADFQKEAEFNSSVDINCPMDISDPVTLSGDGHIRKRLTIGADANTTYNVSAADIVRVASGSLTADRTYTIGSTGAGAGSMMRIYSDDNAFKVSVRRGTDASLIAEVKRGAIGSYQWIDIIWTGSQWDMVGHYNHTA